MIDRSAIHTSRTLEARGPWIEVAGRRQDNDGRIMTTATKPCVLVDKQVSKQITYSKQHNYLNTRKRVACLLGETDLTCSEIE